MPTYLDFKEVMGTSGSVDASFNRTYTRTFNVVVDDASAGPFFAGSHPSLPLIYSQHNEDPYAFCVGLSPARDGTDPHLWIVTATYAYNLDAPVPLAGGGGMGGGSSKTGQPSVDSQQQGYAPGERVIDPMLRPHDYSYATCKVMQVPVDEEPYILPPNIGIRKISNAVGDFFENQPARDIHALRITLGINSRTVPDDVWLNRLQTLNQNAVTLDKVDYQPRTLRMESIAAQRVYEQNVSYYRWTIEFTYKAHWRIELRNSGNRALMPVMDTQNPPQPIAGKWAIQKPTSEYTLPVDLTTDGKLLNPTIANGGAVTPAKPNYLEFHVWPETTWPTPL